jgi:hypothetical protein
MRFAELFQRKPVIESAAPSTAEVGLFLLRTGLGNWLGVDDAGTDIVMVAHTTKETALVAVVPRGAPQNSLLIAPDGQDISVEGDGFTGPAISFRLRRVPGGRAELRHPVAPTRHVGVVSGAPVGKANRVLFDRVGDPVLDRFELHPVGTEVLGMFGRVLLHEISQAVRPPMTANGLMALLTAGVVRIGLAEALIRALPTDQLAVLAELLMGDPAALDLVKRAMRADPWVCDALPRMLEWLAQGRPATRRDVCPAADGYVAVLQSGELRPQAGLALHSLARRTVSPRRGAALLATVRNEGPYLLDWLAHHRAAGFDHAVIYSNDNDDGSDDLLGLLADHGEITWVRNDLAPAARSQWKAYGHAFKALPDLLDFRWTMVLDLDEYVGFRTDLFGSIGDLAGWHEYQHTDAVAMRWLNFASGRLDRWHDAPSTRRFTRREPEVSKLFKSLVRSNLFWHSHAHFPFPTMDQPFSYRLEDGSPCHHMGKLRGISVPEDPVSADTAWVAHHVYRSAGEALVKAARGDCTWNMGDRADGARLDTIVKRFVAMADDPALVSDDRTLHSARGLDAQLIRLRGLPGVRACDEAIKQRFAARIGAVTQAFMDTAVPEGKPREYTQMQNILRRQAEHRRAHAA